MAIGMIFLGMKGYITIPDASAVKDKLDSVLLRGKIFYTQTLVLIHNSLVYCDVPLLSCSSSIYNNIATPL